MTTHHDVDRYTLAMNQAIVRIIDADPHHAGVQIARENCERWLQREQTPAVLEWQQILTRPWSQVRAVLLDETDEGQRLRSSSPFAGILSPQERWRLLEECREAR